jgi:peptidyl-prolyl cis-trans isomerase D
MLSSFRKGGFAQVIMAAVAFTVILVFALEFRAGGRGRGMKVSKECAVEVDGRCVDEKEYFAAFGLVVPRGIQNKQVRELHLRRQVLEGLAERELLISEAERLGLSISEQEVDEELARGRFHVSLPLASAPMLTAQLGLCSPDATRQRCADPLEMARLVRVKSAANNSFDYKIYERSVRSYTNRSPREFKEMQKAELTAERMRDLVALRVRVSEDEAFMLYQRERSRAVVRTVLLQRDWFAKWAADASDEAVNRWAAENSGQVDDAWKTAQANWKEGCPVVSEIRSEFPPDADDQDKVLARDKIEQARKLLGEKRPFAEVARQLSDGATAVQGGELGCLNDSYGEGSKELLEAVQKLEVGAISPVVETPHGFHVLKLDQKLSAADVERVGRRTVARKLAVRFEADERLKKFGQTLIERATKGEKLEDVTRELAAATIAQAKTPAKAVKTKGEETQPALEDALRPKVEISAPFGPTQTPLTNALPSEAPASKAFALERADAVHPDLIATEQGYAVMQLKEKELATREGFQKDRALILHNLRQEKSYDAVSRYLAELRKAKGDKLKVNERFAEDPKTEGRSDDY